MGKNQFSTYIFRNCRWSCDGECARASLFGVGVGTAGVSAGAVAGAADAAGLAGRRLPVDAAAEPVRGPVSAASAARQPSAVQPRRGAQPVSRAECARRPAAPRRALRAHPLPAHVAGARASRGQLHRGRQPGPLGRRLRLPLTTAPKTLVQPRFRNLFLCLRLSFKNGKNIRLSQELDARMP